MSKTHNVITKEKIFKKVLSLKFEKKNELLCNFDFYGRKYQQQQEIDIQFVNPAQSEERLDNITNLKLRKPLNGDNLSHDSEENSPEKKRKN